MLYRYVTFDQDDKGGASTLYRLLPTPKKMAEVWSLAKDNLERRAGSGGEEDEDDLDSDMEDADRDDEPVQRNRRHTSNSNKRRKMAPIAAMGWRMGGRKKLLPAQKIVEDWKRANSNRAVAAAGAGTGGRRAGSKGGRSGGGGESDRAGAGADYSVTPMNPEEDAEVSCCVSFSFVVL